ncbi:MerR family transcriptional regulator [Robertmurraya andreesenii]|uniref:Chromosome-anchoring protein RacA n=1 Tax=Anoxybacillus andreesenii TaxID=1325932 RepID=A0ABT9V0X1_9BACL|nr:MerR family transcriptional regulator [Robertmurraya andreesenii]MDQ0154595.1 chromosome-anchoring protein RacA [Robertmurraya andreesenii]
MNTGAVSKLLGVSSSTIQRWVKHLGLEMERNEFGHFIYTEEDISMLKEFKEQIQKGVPVQEIQIKRQTRRGSVKVQERPIGHLQLLERIKRMERALDDKADSVVTYQLLQHRREIEELRNQIQQLQQLIDKNLSIHEEPPSTPTHLKPSEPIKHKKKMRIRSLFGF